MTCVTTVAGVRIAVAFGLGITMMLARLTGRDAMRL
jgi:hypothetical protein